MRDELLVDAAVSVDPFRKDVVATPTMIANTASAAMASGKRDREGAGRCE